MKNRHLTIAAILLVACAMTAQAQALSLLKTLGGLGISPTQAIGGTKALLGVAKGKLNADEFSQLLSGAPELGKVMEMTGDGSGVAGALGGMMGGRSDGDEAAGEDPSALAASAMEMIPAGGLDALTGNADLVKQFADLGMDASTIAKFAPTLLGAVGKMGGPSTASLLSKGLGLL